MSANIRVLLQAGRYPSRDNDVEIAMPLSEDLIYEALEPVDLPDKHAPIYEQMLCTSELKIKYVMVERQRAAKVISEALTNAILDIMGSKDTKMGYKILDAKKGNK